MKCIFAEELLDQVRAAIKRNVTVWGTMVSQRDRPFPHLVHVTKMKLHSPDAALPSLSSLQGIAPGCIGDLDSVSFVRAIRDEQ